MVGGSVVSFDTVGVEPVVLSIVGNGVGRGEGGGVIVGRGEGTGVGCN